MSQPATLGITARNELKKPDSLQSLQYCCKAEECAGLTGFARPRKVQCDGDCSSDGSVPSGTAASGALPRPSRVDSTASQCMRIACQFSATVMTSVAVSATQHQGLQLDWMMPCACLTLQADVGITEGHDRIHMAMLVLWQPGKSQRAAS